MKKILLLLCQGVEIYEAAAFFDVFGWANTYGDGPVKTTTVSISHSVTSTFGLNLLPEKTLNEIDGNDFDALAIPGGFEEYLYYEDAYSESVQHLIREFNSAKKPIASICVGALPLAKAGILFKKPATTYHLSNCRRQQQLAQMGAVIQQQPLVITDNIGTSTCPVTAIDMAFWLLKKLTSPENCQHIRQLMGFDNIHYSLNFDTKPDLKSPEKISVSDNFPRRHTQRLVLRPLQLEDAAAIFAYRHLPEVSRYQGWIPESVAEVDQFIKKQLIIDINTPGTWFQLAITTKTKELIGDCGLHFPENEPQQVEIGITIHPDFQGQAYATETLISVLEYLFEKLNKHRVYANLDPRNHASTALVKKIGMQYEGCTRKSILDKGEWTDNAVYALLKSEWENGKIGNATA